MWSPPSAAARRPAFDDRHGRDQRCRLVEALIDDDTDTVFHLAAVVSAQAEEDFDLGMRVNLDGTRITLERCRALDHTPRVVYASSVAAFGGDMPDVIDDLVTPNPQTTYGVTKVIGEYLIDDYSRKGFIDGRALRLPTIVVRPGRPNKAASTWASSILREPLAGHAAVCPVTEESKMWMLSPRRVVESFRHAQVLDGEAWGPHRVVNLPGITGSVTEALQALSRAGGNSARRRSRSNMIRSFKKSSMAGRTPSRHRVALRWASRLTRI